MKYPAVTIDMKTHRMYPAEEVATLYRLITALLVSNQQTQFFFMPEELDRINKEYVVMFSPSIGGEWEGEVVPRNVSHSETKSVAEDLTPSHQ